MVITNTVIAAAQASLKRASEQGSRPNPHRDKNFQLPTMHLEFWITLQGIFLVMTIPCTPIAFIYQNPLAISVTWSLLRFGWNLDLTCLSDEFPFNIMLSWYVLTIFKAVCGISYSLTVRESFFFFSFFIFFPFIYLLIPCFF